MYSNFENAFAVWGDWPGGSGTVHIETSGITEDGLEVKAKLPRTSMVV